MDTLAFAMSQQTRGGTATPHSQQENMQLGKPTSLKSGGLSQRSYKSLKVTETATPTPSGKKGLGNLLTSMTATPVALGRRKLGNVSNTPMNSHSKLVVGNILQQQSSDKKAAAAALKEDVFVKPTGTPRLFKKKAVDGLMKKSEFKAPAAPPATTHLTPSSQKQPSLTSASAPPPSRRLPTLYEDRENCYPIPPAQFAAESHPYCTVGMFERDLTSLPFDILEEGDEEEEENEQQKEMTVDDWLAIL